LASLQILYSIERSGFGPLFFVCCLIISFNFFMVESASVANEPEMNNKKFEESSRLLDGIVHWKLIFGEL
jgi:hypothetical protein